MNWLNNSCFGFASATAMVQAAGPASLFGWLFFLPPAKYPGLQDSATAVVVAPALPDSTSGTTVPVQTETSVSSTTFSFSTDRSPQVCSSQDCPTQACPTQACPTQACPTQACPTQACPTPNGVPLACSPQQAAMLQELMELRARVGTNLGSAEDFQLALVTLIQQDEPSATREAIPPLVPSAPTQPAPSAECPSPVSPSEATPTSPSWAPVYQHPGQPYPLQQHPLPPQAMNPPMIQQQPLSSPAFQFASPVPPHVVPNQFVVPPHFPPHGDSGQGVPVQGFHLSLPPNQGISGSDMGAPINFAISAPPAGPQPTYRPPTNEGPVRVTFNDHRQEEGWVNHGPQAGNRSDMGQDQRHRVRPNAPQLPEQSHQPHMGQDQRHRVRLAARRVEEAAWELEEVGDYSMADELRRKATELYQRARNHNR